MFSILPLSKYFSFSIVNSVAAEFQFDMRYSYYIIVQLRDNELNPGLGGWRSSLSV